MSWITRHRAGVIMGKMIVADGHRVGLNPRRDIEIGIGDDFSLAAGMNQKTRMAVPLEEIRTQGQAFAVIAARLNQLASMMKKVHHRRIAHRLDEFTQRQE